MNMTDTNQSETLLEDLGDEMIIDQGDVDEVSDVTQHAHAARHPADDAQDTRDPDPGSGLGPHLAPKS